MAKVWLQQVTDLHSASAPWPHGGQTGHQICTAPRPHGHLANTMDPKFARHRGPAAIWRSLQIINLRGAEALWTTSGSFWMPFDAKHEW